MAKFWKKKRFQTLAKTAGRAVAAYYTGGASEAYLAKAQTLKKQMRAARPGSVRPGSGGGAQIAQNLQYDAPSGRSGPQFGGGGAKPWWQSGGR